MSYKAFRAGVALVIALGAPAYVSAAPVITAVNANLLTEPFTFSFMGSSFSFGGMNTFPDYINVSTTGTGAVRMVAGSPSTDFTNRGAVVYDADTLGGYKSFPTTTTVPTSNGRNFLGLRVTVDGQKYYGFAYTTNAVLNSYGFETAANTGIRATTAIPAAVPEPSSWAMMIAGFRRSRYGDASSSAGAHDLCLIPRPYVNG